MQILNADISINAPPKWFAAYLCPRHEKTVARQLRERNVDCFLPLYRSLRRWKDRKKEVELVLFPGYIFVRLQAEERVRVLQLPGVVRFVSFAGQPATLPDEEIDVLRRGLKDDVYARPHPYLKAGRKVEVGRGPFAGARGVLLRIKEKYRVVLSLDLIMQSVAIEVDSCDVRPLA